MPEDTEWVSIEHNEEWLNNVQESIKDKKNVQLHHVKPDIDHWQSGGSYKEFKSYVDYPEKLGKFDIVLIDGVARESCIQKSFEKLITDKGLIIVHDCNRVKYHKEIMRFPSWLILEDYRRNAGGFGFGSKNIDVSKLVDFEKYSKIWRVDNFLGNLSRFYFLIGKPSKPFRMRSDIK